MTVSELFEEIKPHLTGVQSRVGDIAVYQKDYTIGLAIRLFGEYCHAEIDIMAEYVKPNTKYLDIGTNIGYHLLGMKKTVPNCDAIGFEPNQKHFCVAAYNCQHENITIHNTALGSKKSTIKMTDFELGDNGNYGEIGRAHV